MICPTSLLKSVYDVAIIGAGAAGLFCAGIAASRGQKVVLID
ncbi:MAG: FAD-binding protein, partial [Candidatus Puniceispirillaceae bacterium]